MRNLALFLLVAVACLACAPRASGPPQPGGEGAALNSQAFTSPEPQEHPQATAPARPAEASEELAGTVVEVRDDQLYLVRPSGVELRFLLPPDVRFQPEGRSRADLTAGARVKVQVRHVERGMEVSRLVFEPGRAEP